MYQGSTPTLPIRIPGKDLTNAKLFLTIKDGRNGTIQTFVSGDGRFSVSFDGTDTVGELTLTQQETLAINGGKAEIQVRFIFENGKAGVTKKVLLTVNDVLLKDVISYADE